MIGSRPHVEGFGNRQGRRLLTAAFLTASLILPNIGCVMLPWGMRNLPAKVGLKSEDAELRTKVQADKFPTAKEAGL